MSEKRIYDALREGGLSHNGACAVMGNMYHESLLRSNNVEDRCPLSDSDYTWNVDSGAITANEFARDAYGYGLCQWTYWTRKQELLNTAKAKQVSVSDEEMQCAFCLMELKRDYNGLYQFLCSDSADLQTASDRVCREYERPAYNNTHDRYQRALYYCSSMGKEEETETDSDPLDFGSSDSCTVTVRILRFGSKGRDVLMAQNALNDMEYDCGKPDGDFGSKTEQAVNELREHYGLAEDGTVDLDVWQILFQ